MTKPNHQTALRIIEQQIEFLVPGIELANDICSDDGKILFSQGTILNQQAIKKLSTWGINKVKIIAEVTTNPITDPKVRQFINSYNQSVTVVQKAFDEIRQTQQIPGETFQNFQTTANTITERVMAAGNIIDQLYNLPQCDDYTFRHSVNVSAIAALIATWLKFPPESVSAISLSGLLHDVGKSQLAPRLLNKSSLLSPADYECYKQHTTLGYELANKIPNMAQSILSGLVEHHEREDGSGYPFSLLGENIHPYAKIVAVADLYDEALTINCDQPGALSPYESLENLRTQIHCLDAKVCITFVDNMTNFLSGNPIALTDGRCGRVVCINKNTPSRSMVQLDNGEVLDLDDETDLRIHYIIR